MDNQTATPKFVIGVTGHRDCAEQSKVLIKAHIVGILSQIKSIFFNLDLEMVCGLDEGADSVAAEAALELGINVRAILPKPLDSYEGDFSPEGLNIFRKLTSNSNVIVEEIPFQNLGDKSRETHYVILKDYIVRKSNVLLALWDDQVTGLPGETSDVILDFLNPDRKNSCAHAKTSISRIDRSSTDEDDGNLVISIYTPRNWTAESDGDVQLSYLVSDGAPDTLASLIEFPPHKIAERWGEMDEHAGDKHSIFGFIKKFRG